MKTINRLFTSWLAAGLLATGCIKIADSFLISLVLPAEYCFAVGTTSDLEWGGERAVSIRSLIAEIEEKYTQQVRATWVTDLLIAVSGPYPNAPGATVSGEVEFRIGGLDWTPLLTFQNVPYSALAGGVSLLDPDPSLVIFDDAGVPALLALLTSDTGLPAFDLIELRAGGTTTAVEQPGVMVCIKLVLGADAEIKP